MWSISTISEIYPVLHNYSRNVNENNEMALNLDLLCPSVLLNPRVFQCTDRGFAFLVSLFNMHPM